MGANKHEKVNLLRITNLDYFLEEWGDTGLANSYYEHAYAILNSFQEEIKTADDIENVAAIPYKDFGFVLFNLKKIEIKDNIRVAYYEYSSTAS